MAIEQLPEEELANLLREAEKAHGVYETQLGHRDPDWPTWYAAYTLRQLQKRAAVRTPPTDARG